MMGLSTSPAGRSFVPTYVRTFVRRSFVTALHGLALSLTHARTRARTPRRAVCWAVGVCDSEVMFVASRRVIQGAIRVKVHRIDERTSTCNVLYSFLQPSRVHTGGHRMHTEARERAHAHFRAESPEKQGEETRRRWRRKEGPE